MRHPEHSKKTGMEGKKSHKANPEPKKMEGMPMRDMDAEMGNMPGMCKVVSSKS